MTAKGMPVDGCGEPPSAAAEGPMMRIAEFLNMGREEVHRSLEAWDRTVEEEGGEKFDVPTEGGTTLLFDTLLLDLLTEVGHGENIVVALTCVLGKAFRLGCWRGRNIVAPEKRD